MKTQKNPVPLMILFSIWLALALGCSSLRKAMDAKRAEREGPGITISAEDLYKAYESNEAEADKRYLGKILIVTGTVGSANSGIYANPDVILIDARQKPIVDCLGFAKDEKDAIAKLEVGHKVLVKGECRGKVMGTLALENCVLK